MTGATVNNELERADLDTSAISSGEFGNYFPQANCWETSEVVFGAPLEDLEPSTMLISMIWRF